MIIGAVFSSREAAPVLQKIIDSPDASATLRMMSALRLAKSRRRMHEEATKAFEPSSPLWTGVTLLNHVPSTLKMEYIEETACNLLVVSQTASDGPRKTAELIQAVNSLCNDASSLIDSPPWTWYMEIQQEYLKRMGSKMEPTKAQAKQKHELREEHEPAGGMEILTPSHAAARLPLRGYDDISDRKGPWAQKSILSFDGGGVCAFSSLLILKSIMIRIREVEMGHPGGPVLTSGSYPWDGCDNTTLSKETASSDRVDDFLPCHYFDYMAGTSTGGLNSIMLGRLRMTVDQALDGFMDFCQEVFGQPRLVRETTPCFFPRAKYSPDKVREAFSKIISSSLLRIGEEAQLGQDFINKKPFPYREDRTRTMVISTRIISGVILEPYIWRSYTNLAADNTLSAHGTPIWQVARATCAAPGHFESIQIFGREFLDGGLVATNPSLLAIREFRSLHNMTPALFVSLGTGLRVESGADADSSTPVSMDKYGTRKILKKSAETIGPIEFRQVSTEGQMGTDGWREYTRGIQLDRAYRLNAEGDLSEIPFGDWRPAGTGEITLGGIRQTTDAYLRRSDVREMIDSIAKEAVRIRRARADTERWEAFAGNVF
ncbi:acyl transferase/acyl hydrolase/lysophospholipase [Thelonectria olida]|uniref:Acyl transferase/acyl hydrolase/lysophospholipase n=1 Tax=Thelonectria olida TaxID=1576542 RepID=A0A9P9ARH9_9HYPO|nr:acyl transferase/acyl hydrolase/lysophospholipase [Thelonectria olida]